MAPAPSPSALPAQEHHAHHGATSASTQPISNAVPTLLDCWAVRDLARFRAVLKGGGQVTRQDLVGAGSVGPGLTSLLSRSPGHSWGASSLGTFPTGHCPPAEVNRKDHLGRTVLHLIAASTEPSSVDYLTALLAHPSVNVNVQDGENGWTPLHRALYAGNLLTALTLLRRSPPADTRVKDFEGLTPFDLYNSSVHGTNPDFHLLRLDEEAPREAPVELFTWGANRNFTLGLGDSDDRALPERVKLRRLDEEPAAPRPPGSRYDRIGVRDIKMTKLHSVVLTNEARSNVWVCGINNLGRLGRAPQTQTKFEPLNDFHETAVAIATGPDHTCIVTATGGVYTFGFNRFQQLGYVPEAGQGRVLSSTSMKGTGGAALATFGGAAAGATGELDVQVTPRRLAGSLKKEDVIGVAAGKMHCAAFTADALFTWGTNTGQLGYDRNANPVQISPRKVSAITSEQRISEVAVTDFATCCLLESGDVLCLHNDSSFFVRFPSAGFSSNIQVFRPRQVRPRSTIKRIVAGPERAFAAISDMGDLYTFHLEHPSEYGGSTGAASSRNAGVRPQLVWSVRKNKKVGAAEQVAIGSGSDLIIVTESGHVFVRSRKAESAFGKEGAVQVQPSTAKAGKSGWKPVPFLQRVIRVATNESGGLAAIKADVVPREIKVRGRVLEDDMSLLLAHLKARTQPALGEDDGLLIAPDVAEIKGAVAGEVEAEAADEDESDDDTPEASGEHYVRLAQLIAEAARRWEKSEEGGQPRYDPKSKAPPFGYDLLFGAGSRWIPAHRCIVAARVPSLTGALEASTSGASRTTSGPAGVSVKRINDSFATLSLPGCSFATGLFLLQYLYADDAPAVWSASMAIRIAAQYKAARIDRSQVHEQLQTLARLLNLPALSTSLRSPVPRAPAPTLAASLRTLFETRVDVPIEQSPLHDVRLRFKDRTVPAHSAILRRSPFFAALFQPHWTFARWQDGIISIDMAHMRWEVASIVLRHVYFDAEADLFDGTDAERSPDQWIDFVIEVMAAANELLLDKLKLVCCQLLRRRMHPANVASLLTTADYLHALPLKDIAMDYIAKSMETLLEGRALEDLEHRMVKDLAGTVRRKQDERLHHSQAHDYITALMVKHAEFIEDLDLPPPSLNLVAHRFGRRPPRSPRSLPVDASTKSARKATPVHSPELKAYQPVHTPGDSSFMFSMDEDDEGSPSLMAVAASRASPAPLSLGPSRAVSSSAPWKSGRVEAEKDAHSASPSQSDLRSIMAAEQARRPSMLGGGASSGPSSAYQSGTATPVKQSAAVDPVALNVSAKLSQRDRKKQLQQQAQQVPASPEAKETRPAGWAAASSSSAAWRSTSANPQAAADGIGSPPRATSSFGPSLQAAAKAKQQPAISMGPTYTPTRATATPKRLTGGESVWAPLTRGSSSSPLAASTFAASMGQSPVVSAVFAPTSPPPVTAATDGQTPPRLSLLSIQQEEERNRLAAAEFQAASRKKKSFAELVEEEKRENERRVEEQKRAEEFERWFEEETRRRVAEEARAGRGANGNGAKRGGKGGKGKGTAKGGEAKATPDAKQQGAEAKRGGGPSRGRGRGQSGRGRGGASGSKPPGTERREGSGGA